MLELIEFFNSFWSN